VTASIHNPAATWALAHRAMMAIIVLAAALVATLTILLVNLLAPAATSVLAPSTGGGVSLSTIDNGCAMAHPGQPC
jgi:hypothetical protein